MEVGLGLATSQGCPIRDFVTDIPGRFHSALEIQHKGIPEDRQDFSWQQRCHGLEWIILPLPS